MNEGETGQGEFLMRGSKFYSETLIGTLLQCRDYTFRD